MDKSKFLWIVFGILSLIAIFNITFRSQEKQTVKNKIEVKKTATLTFDEREYFTDWEDDTNENFFAISKLLNTNRTTGCGEFYYNEIEKNIFIVGCYVNGEYFKYYVAYTSNGKLYSAESDMLTVKNPPR